MKSILHFLCALVVPGFILCGAAAAENEALYFPDGELYIPHANLLDNEGNTVRSYAAHLHKFGRFWNFRLYGLSEVAAATNEPEETASTNLVGAWNFAFNESFGRTYDGAAFSRTTNAAPVSTNFVLTLSQSNGVVSGTSTVDSVRYELAGELVDDFFAFTLLAGKTNATLTLAVGHALLADDALEGDYSWSTANGAEVKIGTLSATKQ